LRTDPEKPEAHIRQTFEVNTIAHFWTVREFLPSMIKQNHGHVVTIASMASFVAPGLMADYGSLAFHEALTQEIRHCYRAKKIRTRYVHARNFIYVNDEAFHSQGPINLFYICGRR
jgi:short-subunit dehydrogenase